MKRFVFMFVAIETVSAACSQLTPTDKANIAKDQVELGVCQAEAHFAKLADAGAAGGWTVFDDCMRRKGFYDGGPDAR